MASHGLCTFINFDFWSPEEMASISKARPLNLRYRSGIPVIR